MEKKPFRINLDPLYEIATKMGIKGYIKIGEIERILNTSDGMPLNKFKDIDFTDEGLMFGVDKAGNKHHLTCHIKNQTFFKFFDIKKSQESFHKSKPFRFFGRQKLRVIHLAKCTKIEEMMSKGEFFKYHGSNNKDHIRNVLLKGGERDIKLRVCQNCLQELRLVDSGKERREKARNFDFYEFFETYKGKFDSSMKSEGAKADDYPKNWGIISKQYRIGKGWACECCGVKLAHQKTLLQCHHKNKIKADVRDENLQALCAICHAHAPHHSHIEKDHPDILHARESQGLAKQCIECGG